MAHRERLTARGSVDDWRAQLLDLGYVVVPSVLDERDVEALRTAFPCETPGRHSTSRSMTRHLTLTDGVVSSITRELQRCSAKRSSNTRFESMAATPAVALASRAYTPIGLPDVKTTSMRSR